MITLALLCQMTIQGSTSFEVSTPHASGLAKSVYSRLLFGDNYLGLPPIGTVFRSTTC